MDITEVRIKLMEGSEDRLRAFCSITLDDCFVVRDLKIIDGTSGPFVAMPSRKLAGHCGRCGYKNHLRAHYCNQCGSKVESDLDGFDSPQKLYADVAHPINSECREQIQAAVLEEFEAELSRSRQPGYRSRYDDDFGYEADGPGPEFSQPERTEVEAVSTSQTSVPPSTEDPGGDVSVAIIDQAKAGPPKPKQDQRDAERRSSRVDAGEANARDNGGESDEVDFGAGIFD